MKHFYPILFLIFVYSCEDKVAKEDKVDPTKLTGQVILENQTDHSNAVVYIDGVNKGTITDSTGAYTISIDGDTIKDGSYDIYYFLVDYALSSSTIRIENNEILFGEGSVDKNGLLKPVELKQFIQVNGWSDNSDYSVGDSIEVKFTFTNVSDKPLRLSIERYPPFTLIALYSSPDEIIFPIGEITPYQFSTLNPGGSIVKEGKSIIPEGIRYLMEYYRMKPGTYKIGSPIRLNIRENDIEYGLEQQLRKTWYDHYSGPYPYGTFGPHKFELPTVTIRNDNPAEDFWVKTGASNEIWFNDMIIDSQGNWIASSFLSSTYVSSDKGDTWTEKKMTGSRISPLSITGNDELYIATESGVLKSIDHGYTWETIYFDSCKVYAFESGENGLFFAGTDCGNYVSKDHGDSWTEISFTNPEQNRNEESFIDYFAISPTGKYYAGNLNFFRQSSRILYSSDGLNWTISAEWNHLCSKSFIFNSNSDVFVGSMQGSHCSPPGLWRSMDSGTSWIKISDDPYNIFTGIVDKNGNIYLGGYLGIFVSKDQGSSWERLNDIGLGRDDILKLLIDSEGHLIAVSDWGGIYRTAKPLNE